MTMCRFANLEKVLFPALFGLRVDHIDDGSMNSTRGLMMRVSAPTATFELLVVLSR